MAKAVKEIGSRTRIIPKLNKFPSYQKYLNLPNAYPALLWLKNNGGSGGGYQPDNVSINLNVSDKLRIKPGYLSLVATSGDYDDLINKPDLTEFTETYIE
jgi:hypothetical protein